MDGQVQNEIVLGLQVTDPAALDAHHVAVGLRTRSLVLVLLH